MNKNKEFYRVPFYKSYSGIKELKKAGSVVCYFATFFVREAVTRESIYMLKDDEIEKNGFNEYATDKFTLLNIMHKSSIDENGVMFYVKESDFKESAKVSIEEVIAYSQDFENSDYYRETEEANNRKKKIKH